MSDDNTNLAKRAEVLRKQATLAVTLEKKARQLQKQADAAREEHARAKRRFDSLAADLTCDILNGCFPECRILGEVLDGCFPDGVIDE